MIKRNIVTCIQQPFEQSPPSENIKCERDVILKCVSFNIISVTLINESSTTSYYYKTKNVWLNASSCWSYILFISDFYLNHSHYVNSAGSDFDNFGVKASLTDARFYMKSGVGLLFSNFYFAPFTFFFQLMLADTLLPFSGDFSNLLKWFPCLSKTNALHLESTWLVVLAWFTN